MNTIPYNKFKHGQRVTCEIKGDIIEDAKISIDYYGMIYICQNKMEGDEPEDKLGYKYGWKITYKKVEFFDGKESVKNLQFHPRTIDDLEEGDVVVDTDGCEQKVLGICGNVYFLSEENEFTKVDEYYYTTQELEDNGYTLKQEEEKLEFREPTEAESKIIENPVLIINEDETQIRYNGKTYILSK